MVRRCTEMVCNGCNCSTGTIKGENVFEGGKKRDKKSFDCLNKAKPREICNEKRDTGVKSTENEAIMF